MQLGIVYLETFDICYILSGMFLAIFFLSFYILKIKKQIKQIKRQYEKKSIGADDSSLKIKTLENKIATLEVALKKQMGK